ncbi:MAG: hypothetical protein LBS36_01415 [Oscillospiraceae bacterium]|nr:hypothetical protein [Oscillospiraceae bacterium]
MKQDTLRQQQDILQFSVKAWEELLKDPAIFDDKALRMIRFVYHQDNCQTTAAAIAQGLSTPTQKLHYNSIYACNRKLSNAVYQRFNKKPPPDIKGTNRLWNLLFDSVPEKPTEKNGRCCWRLRPNLAAAVANLFE